VGHSFTGAGTGSLGKSQASKRAVLVTGAAGRIGSYFAEHSYGRYDLRLMVQNEEQAASVRPYGEVVQADLGNLDAMKRVCAGIDTVVHMAGNPDAAATWKPLLETNIVGTYNAMVAAKCAGCRRLIFASSIHAVSGYPREVQVKTSEPPNPGDLYGVTKAFGEALGRYMAEQEGLSVIALRIGGFQSVENAMKEWSIGMADAWVTDRDLTQLIQKCIDNENLKFAIFHGLSNNAFNRLDISDARELVGYDPQDDCFALNPKLAPFDLANTLYKHSVDKPERSGLRDDLR
jgi:UDP-glucose 4-epimerase